MLHPLTAYPLADYSTPGREALDVTMREARERRGLTQAQLGRLLGWFQTRVSKYELGTCTPSVHIARAIEDALGVPRGSLEWPEPRRPASGE